MSLIYKEWNKAVAPFQLSNYLYMLRTEKQRILCLLWTIFPRFSNKAKKWYMNAVKEVILPNLPYITQQKKIIVILRIFYACLE